MADTTFQSTEAKINVLLRDIYLSFRVSAGLFDRSGRQMGCCGFETRSNFCRFIHFYDAKQICRESYLQSFCQCAANGEPLVYFCPFGLVNITFPLTNETENPYFVTVGPLLYHKPDDHMISSILNLNYLLKPRAREIRQNLGELEVKSEAEVHSMVAIIKNAIRGATNLLLTETTVSETASPHDISNSLRLWLRANPYDGDTAAFLRALKEARPPTAKLEKDYSAEDMERLVTKISDFIFETDQFPLMLHRALKYLEYLMEFCRKSGLLLEQFFYPKGINIDKIRNAKTKDTLEQYILQSNTLFMNTYASTREVRNKDVIYRAMHYMRGHYGDISLVDVAEHVNLNATYFSNLFKRSTGQSYSLYLNKIRIEESKRLLLEDYGLSEIAQKIGFSDQSYFTNVFKKIEGISPNRWKNAQRKKEVPF